MRKVSKYNVLRMFLARYSVQWEKPVISNELDSYFGNSEACTKFAKHDLRFSDERELRHFLSNGRLTILSEDVLSKIKNFASSIEDVQKKLSDQTYALSYKELENKLEQGDLLLEAPIVIQFKDNSYWFYSGRKRAYVARKHGASVQYFLVKQLNSENNN